MDGMISTKEIRGNVAPEYQPYIVALTAQAMRGDRYETPFSVLSNMHVTSTYLNP
jgi:hypothetical protein